MKRIRTLLVLSLLLAGCYYAFGQPGRPPGGGGKPCPLPPCPPVPISGIEILVGAGALLGAKRIMDLTRTKK